MGEPPNWSALLDGLGKTWEVANNSIKPYPAGFVIHPLLDLALEWRKQNPGATVEKVAAACPLRRSIESGIVFEEQIELRAAEAVSPRA